MALSCPSPIIHYNQTEHDLFFSLIERAHALNLTDQDVDISDPEQTLSGETRVLLAPKPHTPLTGHIELSYGRISLEKFFFGVPLSFMMPEQSVDMQWVSDQIQAKWSVYFDPEQMSLETCLARPGHPQQVKVSAKPTSLVWYGSVDVWLIPEGLFGQTFLDAPISFNTQTLSKNAYLYTQQKPLVDLPVETLTLFDSIDVFATLTTEIEQILLLLREKTGDDWVLVPEAQAFNLKDARVVYQGHFASDDHSDATVIVIELSSACKNLFGYLTLYCQMPALTVALDTPVLTGFQQAFTETNLPGFTL